MTPATPSESETGHPVVGPPTTGQPTTGQPTTGQPTTGPPTTGQPTTGQPAVRQPAAADGGASRRPDTVAEALIRTLASQQVDVIFLNPGTDTAPFQEAVAALGAAGEPVPRVVLCPHEGVALAAAHAYFAVTGRPQVVMVHVDVGTQNLGSMVHNAARADAGVVVIAGRTPVTADGELPGGRDTSVHWMQDVTDQAGVVRSYVKWTGDLASPATAVRQLVRAFQVAASGPCGPVYLTAARELLMQPVPEGLARLTPRRHRPPARPAPDPGELRRAARVLAASARPVVITTRLGQRPEAVAALIAVVEALGAVVIDGRERMNFPSDHPAYLSDTRAARAALARADAVLAVDSPVPWVPQVAAPPESATVISMDLDPVRVSMPGWTLPVDIGLQCDPGAGLRELHRVLLDQGSPARPPWRPDPGPAPAPPAVGAPTAARADDGQPRMSVLDVADALNDVLDERDIVVEEATTAAEMLRGRLRRTQPGSYFRSGGSGLGWGLGAALGTKLAAPRRRIVAVVGDGAFLFASPAAALWAMRAHAAPTLVVVLRNGGYAASRRPVFDLFPDGRSAATGEVLGTLFADSPDFGMIAEACDAYGEHARSHDELRLALRHGLDAVDGGRSAVLVAHVRSPWI